MAETETVVESPAAVDDFADYVRTENAREAAGESAQADPEPEPAAVAEPPKLDKRTREGRKQSIQQDIDSTYAKKKEAEREYQAEVARLAAVRAEIAAEATRAPKPAAAAPTKPVTSTDRARYMAMPDAPKNDGSYASYDDYQADMAIFIADKRFEERAAQATAQSVSHERAKTFADRCAASDKTSPGWESRINPDFLNATTADGKPTPYVPISKLEPHERGDYRNGIAEVILTSENPVGLMEYLTDHATDPDVQRLSTLPPDQFFRQMGRLEARVTAAHSGPAASAVIPSKARPVIKPVTADATVRDDDEDDLSVEEHIRRENAKDPRINPRAARH